MVATKLGYTPPTIHVINVVQNMSLLNSLSANLVFDDMEDGGEYEGEEF